MCATNPLFASDERSFTNMKYGLDEIKTFLAVVESGSISGASTRLAMCRSLA